MKILAVGDIHGKTVWRQVVKNVPADITVFIGDYIIVRQWLFNKRFRINLEEILEYKRANFDRVYLLHSSKTGLLNAPCLPKCRLAWNTS